MSFMRLDSESVLARVSKPERIPTCLDSLVVGSLGFGLVSLGVFATVAYGEGWLFRHLGRSGSYLFWALLFTMGAGAVLNRLVIGPGSLIPFYAAFTLSFLAYAAVWTAAYFVLKGLLGEWVGSIAGTILMGLILCGAFGAVPAAVRGLPVLVAGNLAGYFLGRLVWSSLSGRAGMMGWGIIYGLGFGLGLGYALYVCQEKIRAQLSAKAPAGWQGA